jgi:hypothetical protein
MVKDKTLLEKLAAIEHDQWIAWAQTILETENVSPNRRKRLQEYFVPYEQLSEDVKEHDRVWARKVIEEINNS